MVLTLRIPILNVWVYLVNHVYLLKSAIIVWHFAVPLKGAQDPRMPPYPG